MLLNYHFKSILYFR